MLRNLLKRYLIRNNLFARQITSSTGSESNKRRTFFDEILTHEEKENILNIFNLFGQEDFRLLKVINDNRAKSIVEYRDKHGSFKTLSELLNIQGMEPLMLAKFCTVLRSVDPDKMLGTKDSSAKRITHLTCHPSMDAWKAKAIKTVCALDVNSAYMTYTFMDHKLKLWDWNRIVLFNTPTIRYDHILYQTEISRVIGQSLPKADAYVMEEPLRLFPSLSAAKFQANQMVLFALVAALLNKDFPTEANKVFVLKQSGVSRVFGLDVGGERVSCIEKVKEGFKGRPHDFGDVSFSEDLKKDFLKLPDEHQHFLATVLLINYAFVKHCVLPQSQ